MTNQYNYVTNLDIKFAHLQRIDVKEQHLLFSVDG